MLPSPYVRPRSTGPRLLIPDDIARDNGIGVEPWDGGLAVSGTVDEHDSNPGEFNLYCEYVAVGGIEIQWLEPAAASSASKDFYCHAIRTHMIDTFRTMPSTSTEGEAAQNQLVTQVMARAAPCNIPTTTCDVMGRVTNAGKPVEGIHIQLNGPGLQVDTATDSDGRYKFSNFANAGFDPKKHNVSVSLFLAHKDRFKFVHKTDDAELRTLDFGVEPTDKCVADFTTPASYPVMFPDSVQKWDDLWVLYRQLERAWRFAEIQLLATLDYLPLKIVTWCDSSVRSECNDAFYIGSQTPGNLVSEPHIYLDERYSGEASEKLNDTMYHEFGHHVMADVYGENPHNSASVSHAGYYANDSSTAGWVEGFATWFSTTVAKYMETSTTPRTAPAFRFINGTVSPLEPDVETLAWGRQGKDEEEAVTGILLDLEDGSDDYASVKPPVVNIENSVRYKEFKTKSGDTMVIGLIERLPPDALAIMKIRFLDASGKKIAVRPVHIDASDPATRRKGNVYFWTIAPKNYATFEFVGLRENLIDDDPVDLELDALWSAIETASTTDSKSGKQSGYAHLFDVHELYQAMTLNFGGRDSDADGVDDIDQVFVAHGFFADDNGNFKREDSERPGYSNHPQLDANGQPTGSARVRTTPEPAEVQMAAIDSHGVEASYIGFVTFPEPNEAASYSYVADPDAEGKVPVAVPAEGSGGRVTLIATAESHLPDVVAELDEQSFWAEAREHAGESFLAYDVELEPGEISFTNDTRKRAGMAAAALGFVLVLGAWVLLRRTRRPPAPKSSG